MSTLRMSIARRYVVQAAHRLPHVPPGHKCGNLHGHTYEVEIVVRGPIDPTLGWVADFAWLDAMCDALFVKKLDHHYLNEIEGLENPTSEIIALWIWQRLEVTSFPNGCRLHRVAIHENARSTAAIDASE